MPTIARTILVVEDDPFIRELCVDALVKALTPQGATVSMAESGTDALAKINELQGELALIFLDILLPDQNGYEILQYMRDRPALSQIPVVVLSNLAQDDEIERAKQLGARQYIVKAQVDVADIVAVAQTYLV